MPWGIRKVVKWCHGSDKKHRNQGGETNVNWSWGLRAQRSRQLWLLSALLFKEMDVEKERKKKEKARKVHRSISKFARSAPFFTHIWKLLTTNILFWRTGEIAHWRKRLLCKHEFWIPAPTWNKRPGRACP